MTEGLDDVRNKIAKSVGVGVIVGSIDLLETLKELINVLDTTISVGIGRAISSKYVQTYLKK